MSKGIKRGLTGVAVLVVVLVASAVWIESVGQKFFNNGKDIKESLLALSFKLRAKDMAAAQTFYAAEYQGTSLGLNTRKLAEDKGGIHRLLQSSDGSKADRKGALDEWRTYLDSFDSIESVALNIHRLDKWDSRDNLAARVRFEVIGTPRGAKYAGIDRGFLSMTFREGGAHGMEITSGSFLEGDRYISDTPQFKDVAAEAGVNFTNRYYPAFIEQKLKFAMIRYGPAGITAADYDNDGFYDIVESRTALSQNSSATPPTASSKTSPPKRDSPVSTASASPFSPTTTTTASKIYSSAAPSSPISSSTTTTTAPSLT